jgi:hypothetical protein
LKKRKYEWKIEKISSYEREDILSKNEILTAIKNFSKQAHKNGARGLKIYYTGHGWKLTGNWPCLGKNFLDKKTAEAIKLSEVLDTIKESGFNKKLGLTCDCCHSGKWG